MGSLMRINAKLNGALTDAVKSAGKALIRERRTGDYRYIEDSSDESSSIHTGYDKLANELLLGRLLPGLCHILNTDTLLVISEELDAPSFYSESQGSLTPAGDISLYPGYVLVVDPICGSIPFVRGIADYIIAIAVMKELACIASVVYQPELNELFYAERGSGATLNGSPLSPPSDISELCRAYVSVEHQAYKSAPSEDIRELATRVMRLRTAGTCALEMCYVACGRLDGLIKLDQSFYDYIPGVTVHAGGRIAAGFCRAGWRHAHTAADQAEQKGQLYRCEWTHGAGAVPLYQPLERLTVPAESSPFACTPRPPYRIMNHMYT